MADLRSIAVVQNSKQASDVGAVFQEGAHLVIFWPDGHVDPVFRDYRGHLYFEPGDAHARCEMVREGASERRERMGAPLLIISRSSRKATAIKVKCDASFANWEVEHA